MLYKKDHSDYRYCILHRLYIIKNYVEGRLLPHDVCFNVPTPFHQRTRNFRLSPPVPTGIGIYNLDPALG